VTKTILLQQQAVYNTQLMTMTTTMSSKYISDR